MSKTSKFDYDKLLAKAAVDRQSVGTSKRGKYDFAVAYPDPESLPLDGLLAGLQQAFAEDGRDLALYHHTQGYPPLREFVANKLARDRDIHITPDDLILTSGSGHPIYMILEVLVDPGDVVLTDDFIYGGTLNQMRRFRANIRGVATDDNGMIPDALEATIQQAIAEGKPPKVLYLVPTFQNPQGWTMSLERRKEMLRLAQQYGIPILEDDCYVDLRYDGRDVTSLYSLDDTDSVMYVASFSKIIAPGMRLGYMTAPRPLLERALAVKSGGSVNTFAAFAVHRFSTTQLGDHIELINDIQRTKRDAMLTGLDEHFSGTGSTWSRPDGGLYIWLQLPEGADVLSIRDKVLETADVGYLPGTSFAPDRTSGKDRLRLCFGYNQPDEIQEGIGRLAAAFRAEGML